MPYHVCGAQQDAQHRLRAERHRAADAAAAAVGGGGRGAATAQTYSAGGAEPGYIAPDPNDPDVFFAGGNNGSFLTRLNRRTGEEREVGPYPRMFSGEPSSAMVERWQWTYPIIFSPVDPHVLYTVVAACLEDHQRRPELGADQPRPHPPRSEDDGTVGRADHARHERPRSVRGGLRARPGKTDVNVIWAGSDDGLIHVTRDGGKTLDERDAEGDARLRPRQHHRRVGVRRRHGLCRGEASAARRLAPYIFRTHDFGKTWTKIVDRNRPDDYVHVRARGSHAQGPALRGAPQHGVYISYDDGDHWQSLSLNLPDVPVSDLIVESQRASRSRRTGAASTSSTTSSRCGRWLAGEPRATAPICSRPAAAIRGAGAPTIEYWLKHPAQSLTIECSTRRAVVIRTIRGQSPARPAGARAGRGAAAGGAQAAGFAGGGGRGAALGVRWPRASTRADVGPALPGRDHFPGMILWGASTSGPAAVPGHVQVRLTVDGKSQTQPLVVQRHPLYTDVTQTPTCRRSSRLAIADPRQGERSQQRRHPDPRASRQEIADRLTKSTDASSRTAGDSLDARPERRGGGRSIR